MKLFDLHADTLTACFEKSESLRENKRQVSLKKAEKYSAYAQVFAIFVNDDQPADAWKYFERVQAYAMRQFSLNQNKITLCLSPEDLQSTLKQGKIAALLSIENGRVLAGKIENLFLAYTMGVRLLTFCWNGENELGMGAVSGNGGLTDFGKRIARECEKKKIIVDVSHLSDKGFYDLAELSERPFVASHSNARAVCGHPRNLSDEQICTLVRRGGLIGINLHMPFLRGGGATMEDIYRHAMHFLERGCQDVLALGGDFDGADLSPMWDSVDKVDRVCEYLYSRGLSGKILEKLFFSNAYHFFMKNL